MANLKNTRINTSEAIGLPSGTSAERPNSPVLGMMRYNTEEEIVEVYNGEEWIAISAGGSSLFEFPIGTTHTFTVGDGQFSTPPTLSSLQSSYPSWAQDSDFFSMPEPGIQQFTIPENGVYEFTAYGGSGGSNSGGSRSGGRGYIVRGSFNLVKGEKINILVGHRGVSESDGGGSSYNGGGGGTFIWKNSDIGFGSIPSNSDEPLLAAGGGGGASDTFPDGVNASSGTSGTNNRDNSASGGSGGAGGNINNGQYPATAGAGWRGNGEDGHTSCNFLSTESVMPTLGGDGGRGGGNDEFDIQGSFGGGGGAAQRCGSAGGGGGGGYSGGAGGNFSQGGGDSGGGGGGSFIDTSRAVSSSNVGLHARDNNGLVEIERIG